MGGAGIRDSGFVIGGSERQKARSPLLMKHNAPRAGFLNTEPPNLPQSSDNPNPTPTCRRTSRTNSICTPGSQDPATGYTPAQNQATQGDRGLHKGKTQDH